LSDRRAPTELVDARQGSWSTRAKSKGAGRRAKGAGRRAPREQGNTPLADLFHAPSAPREHAPREPVDVDARAKHARGAGPRRRAPGESGDAPREPVDARQGSSGATRAVRGSTAKGSVDARQESESTRLKRTSVPRVKHRRRRAPREPVHDAHQGNRLTSTRVK